MEGVKHYYRSGGCLFVVLLLFLGGCHRVPETGRRAFVLMPLGQEMAMGEEAFQEIRAQEETSTDTERSAMVERVGRRIAAEAEEDLPEAEWEFVLFEGDMVNAFALPGGGVGVYEGLLDVAETEDGLAVVMGHEIAHVTARHGAERMSRALSLAAVGAGIGIATRNQDAKTREALMVAYGLGATIGVELPFSRRAEAEADEIGLMYSARAGYDPREAIDFWQRMSEAARDRPQPPAWLSTHPTDEDRIENLQEVMPRALEEYEEATGRQQRFSSQ